MGPSFPRLIFQSKQGCCFAKGKIYKEIYMIPEGQSQGNSGLSAGKRKTV